MSVLSDFFVASPAEIAAERLRAGPASIFTTVSATSLTTLEMALLLQVMQGGDLNGAVERTDEFTAVTDWGAEGPWVYKLPDALRDALAAGSPEDLTGYAVRWLQAEELAGSDQATLTSLLAELAHLSRQAQSEGKALYLWVCL